MFTTAVANAKSYDWSSWALGIQRSFLSGAGASISAGLGLLIGAPGQFNLSTGLWATLRVVMITGGLMGFYRMAEFLQLHGAPDQLQATLDKAAASQEKAAAAIDQAKSQAPPDAPKGE